jgi:type IV secretory pathway VirB10-like protein
MPIDSDNKEEKKESSKTSKSLSVKSKKIIVIAVVASLILVVVSLIFLNKDKETQEPTTNKTVQENNPETNTNSSKGEDKENSSEKSSEDESKPWLSSGSDEPSQEDLEKEQEKKLEEIKDSKRDPNGLKPGLKDLTQDTIKENTSSISKDTFSTDLNGKTISDKYKINDIKTTVDFVSYVKKRATTGKGVELYWLDGEYHGQKVKIQVPLKIFKEMGDVGVVPVDVEITTVDMGDDQVHEVATYFSVRPDYKEAIERNR